MPSVLNSEVMIENDPLSCHCPFKKVMEKKVLYIFRTPHIDVQIKFFRKNIVGKFLGDNDHNIFILKQLFA